MKFPNVTHFSHTIITIHVSNVSVKLSTGKHESCNIEAAERLKFNCDVKEIKFKCEYGELTMLFSKVNKCIC